MTNAEISPLVLTLAVYRRLKQQEMEKQQAVMDENASIATSVQKKLRMLDDNKSVVSSAATYANNQQYVHINSGGDTRIQLGAGIHPLNPGTY